MPIPVGGQGNVDTGGRVANRTVRRREVERSWRATDAEFRGFMRERVEQISEQLGALSGVVSTFSDSLARTSSELFELVDATETIMEKLKESDRGDGADGSHER